MGKDNAPAGGLEALRSTALHTLRDPGLRRGIRALSVLNQERGFDCPGCAWPDPSERSAAEFCENGAKAVAHEATTRKLTAQFFERWPISQLLEQSDLWLERQGRLCEPLFKAADSDHYAAISWDAAFERLGASLQSLSSPNRAIFYTSGRTSNEAAFLYQLFVREFGTNNLPDCSNMCHESSGTGLSEVIGVGKGTVSLDDFDSADVILLLGQNPGSNHPRMLTTLEEAAKRGCEIISINPLKERALVRFAHPKNPRSWFGRGSEICNRFLQVRIGGDVALLQGIAKAVLELETREPGRILDWEFIRQHTDGFDAYRKHLEATSWDSITETSGIARESIEATAVVYAGAPRVIACWAMGLTQHRHGVANIQEITNLLLLRGNLGRRGAGVCPVRGHSNVQGDRTMGIWEKPKPEFLDALEREFGFAAPRENGHDTLAAIAAMQAGQASVFLGMGGNFAAATPDTPATEAALRRCTLTAHVATKLNRSHLITGTEALLLPCLGRTERDAQETGQQFVSVENSMSVVHRSEGALEPASPKLRSEPAIVAGIAKAALGIRSAIDWDALVANYDGIRDHIERVIPGFEDFNRRVRQPGGFTLPNGARDRSFATASGRAHFTVHALPRIELNAGEYVMMTIRSHNQYNTTVYGEADRYRGISDRRAVLMNPLDIESEGLQAQQWVDLTSRFEDEERTVRSFRIEPYDVPRRCVATYFPEANALVAAGSFAQKSRTPAYKSVVVRFAAGAAPR